MKTGRALRFMGKRMITHKTCDGRQRKILITAAPLVVAGLGGLIAKLAAGKKNGGLTQTKEEIAGLVGDGAREIDRVVTDLKQGIQNKSASQLEKSIDSTVKSAKEHLDRIAGDIKKRLRDYEHAYR